MRTVDADKLMERAKMHSIMVSTTLGHFDYGMTLGMLNEIVKECETSAPVGDTVSRQTVLNLLSTMPQEEAITRAMLMQSVKQMSAAQPERKRGKWVKAKGWSTPGSDPVWECSECGKGIHVYGIEYRSYSRGVADGQWVSCPNCGADMRGEQDG